MTAFTTRPELTGDHGMVASTHWLASQSGMAVLEAGGNAFDAAVAAGFVLHVVEPHLNGPGGDMPLLAWSAARRAPFVVCGQGVAPAAATPDAFADLGLDRVPGTGLLAACVPGTFGAWMLLLRDHGTLRLRDALRYAVGYARHGFPVLGNIAATIGRVEGLLTDHWPSSRDVWLPGGRVPEVGSRMTNPDLARTLERIVEHAEATTSDRDEQVEAARRCFYEGFVAEAIAELYAGEAMDVTGTPHRGLLSFDDLASWRATEEEPVGLDHHGHRVLKAGPWSQGPALLQQLALLEGHDLAGLDPTSPDLVHLTVEAAKLALADREAWYGDPDHVEVPLADLLSPAYADERRRLLAEDRAVTHGLHPGSPGGRSPRLPRVLGDPAPVPAGAGTGEPTVTLDGETRGDTCHLDVADRFGNLVSATPSGGWLQSSPVVPGLGFPISTRAQMFWVEPGLPNSVGPRKRPRTTLSPSLALRDDGSPYLAFGTPGGDMQDQWQLLFLVRHLHQGMNLQEAIDAPAWHTTHAPSSFWPREAEPGRVHVEGRLGDRTIAELRRRGHDVAVQDPWSLGRLSGVSRDPDGTLRAGANPRGMQGYAVGR
ncbi:gamma-glutamyltransferase family protein [Nocardioides sp. GXQ0305]|uniref:gamma-glutamyltransferase family protein n=1 Tax=Nocardioides sp. GXQ0305 TaxID=3423912 RepID=UPI003D7E8A5F